jgi:hypothetical protein
MSGISLGNNREIRGVPGKVLKLLKKTAIRPLNDIVKTKEYLEDNELCCIRGDNKDVKSAVSAMKSIMCHWTIADYQKFYSTPGINVLWSAHNQDHFESYYYNYEESVQITKDFLNFQFDNDEAIVSQFCTELYNILERKVRKRNCMTVVSEHTAGKNFFFDSIFDYYMNTGMVQNMNKYSQFPFMNILDARLGFWNEPNYEPKNIEELKNLFEGKPFPGSVKFQDHAPIRACPIIVMSNREPSY